MTTAPVNTTTRVATPVKTVEADLFTFKLDPVSERLPSEADAIVEETDDFMEL
jgi:hypothetical protein